MQRSLQRSRWTGRLSSGQTTSTPPEETPIEFKEALQEVVGPAAEPQEPPASYDLAEGGLPPGDTLLKGLVANLSVKRALAKYGTAAEAVIKQELQQMLEKGVFELVPVSSKLPITAITSFMLVKEKPHLMDPSTS